MSVTTTGRACSLATGHHSDRDAAHKHNRRPTTGGERSERKPDCTAQGIRHQFLCRQRLREGPDPPATGSSTNVTRNRPTTNTPRYPHIKNVRRFFPLRISRHLKAGRLRAVPSNRFPEPKFNRVTGKAEATSIKQKVEGARLQRKHRSSSSRTQRAPTTVHTSHDVQPSNAVPPRGAGGEGAGRSARRRAWAASGRYGEPCRGAGRWRGPPRIGPPPRSTGAGRSATR